MASANARSLGQAVSQPLSNSQKEIWFASQIGDAAAAAFNQSFILELEGPLDTGALDAIVGRHDALRTTFSPVGDQQYVHEDLPLVCPVVDLSGQHLGEQSKTIESRLCSEAQTPFDFAKGPMIASRQNR